MLISTMRLPSVIFIFVTSCPVGSFLLMSLFYHRIRLLSIDILYNVDGYFVLILYVYGFCLVCYNGFGGDLYASISSTHPRQRQI